MNVPAKIAALASKLGPLIRLLSSDKDGEVVAAARAIMRTLKSGGTDIHDLACYLENAPLPAAPMPPQWSPPPAAVTLADKVRFCADRIDRLGDKERGFILQVLRTVNCGGRFSQKQGQWIADIYRRLGGRS